MVSLEWSAALEAIQEQSPHWYRSHGLSRVVHLGGHILLWFLRPQDGRLTDLCKRSTWCAVLKSSDLCKHSAWLSAQRVKGWYDWLSWAAVFLRCSLCSPLETPKEHSQTQPLKLNKSDGTCPCLESTPWSAREKKPCWPKVTKLAATNVLIWAQPFMDHHLVILHLYCPRYTLLSRIRQSAYRGGMIYKTYICNKGISTIQTFFDKFQSGRLGFHSWLRSGECFACAFTWGSRTRKEEKKRAIDWFRYFLALSHIISHHWRHLMLGNRAIKEGNCLWAWLWNGYRGDSCTTGVYNVI